MRLYQFSYGTQQSAVIDDGGREIRLAAGDRFSLSGTLFDVVEVVADAESIIIRNSESGTAMGYGTGEKIGGGVLRDFTSRPVSAFLGVYDPGFLPALIALSLVIIGLALTFGKKIVLQLKEEK